MQTTAATIRDNEAMEAIHAGLARQNLLPSVHVVDTGYTDAGIVLTSQTTYGVTICGPLASDSSWQASDPAAFDITQFQIDWAAKRAICPQGHASIQWIEQQDRHGSSTIRVKFRQRICRVCPVRAQCTRTPTAARGLSLRPQAQHEVLQHARQHQKTPAFKQQYALRAGVEGLMSHAVRVGDVRHSRYVGSQKTHLQHVLTACALNLLRSAAWVAGESRRQTRVSRLSALNPAGRGMQGSTA